MQGEKLGAALMAAMMVAGWTGNLDAQTPVLSAEVRGAYGSPLSDFRTNTDGDWGFGLGGVVMMTESFGVFGGWGRDSFACTNLLCDADSRLHASGLELGARLQVPTSGGPAAWLRVGMTSHTIEFDGDPIDFESDRRWGFVTGAGLDVPLGAVLSVSPGLRLNLLSVDDDDFFDDPEVRYLSVDITGRIHLTRN